MPNPDVKGWSPKLYQTNAIFVPKLGETVLEMLAPQPNERILDLGCGDGTLTEKLVASGAQVVGVDADHAMIAAARARGIDAHVMDGHALLFDAEFDAVFSNAALHWMTEPQKVADGVFRALKPGGRFVGEFGGFGNIAAIRAGCQAILQSEGFVLLGTEPQYYPTDAEYSAVLSRAGLMPSSIALIPRPTPLPTGLRGWLHTFRQGFIDPYGVPETRVDTIIEDICAFLQPFLADASGHWVADYVRLRFTAIKPA